MRIDILTLFPDMFTPYLETSIIGRAIKNGFIEVHCHNSRSMTHLTAGDSGWS